jgi:hypothetical protein
LFSFRIFPNLNIFTNLFKLDFFFRFWICLDFKFVQIWTFYEFVKIWIFVQIWNCSNFNLFKFQKIQIFVLVQILYVFTFSYLFKYSNWFKFFNLFKHCSKKIVGSSSKITDVKKQSEQGIFPITRSSGSSACFLTNTQSTIAKPITIAKLINSRKELGRARYSDQSTKGYAARLFSAANGGIEELPNLYNRRHWRPQIDTSRSRKQLAISSREPRGDLPTADLLDSPSVLDFIRPAGGRAAGPAIPQQRPSSWFD